jgi:hypothetical protein
MHYQRKIRILRIIQGTNNKFSIIFFKITFLSNNCYDLNMKFH